MTIIEAKSLPGVNVNPMVAVTAAGKTRKTSVKFYTNNPYYNSFFSFEYFCPRVAVLDELIWIRVSGITHILIILFFINVNKVLNLTRISRILQKIL